MKTNLLQTTKYIKIERNGIISQLYGSCKVGDLTPLRTLKPVYPHIHKHQPCSFFTSMGIDELKVLGV